MYQQYQHSQHILDHNLLNIQWIFDLIKVLESWDSGLSNHTIKYYISGHCWYKSWHSVQNIIYSMLCMSTSLTLLKIPHSHLSRTLIRLKIGWILRKLWAKMYWECQHCQYNWKALILSFPELWTDPLNIKNVMCKNVCICLFFFVLTVSTWEINKLCKHRSRIKPLYLCTHRQDNAIVASFFIPK